MHFTSLNAFILKITNTLCIHDAFKLAYLKVALLIYFLPFFRLFYVFLQRNCKKNKKNIYIYNILHVCPSEHVVMKHLDSHERISVKNIILRIFQDLTTPPDLP